MENPLKSRFSSSKLNKVEKGLYAREFLNEESQEILRPFKKGDIPDVPSDWKEEAPNLVKPRKMISISGSGMKKIMFFAIGFFLVSGAFAAFIFFGGLNRVSTDNVAIVIEGPSSIGAGEPLSFNFSIENKNNVPLEGVNVLVEYPIGTRTADNGLAELLRENEPVGNIAAGETIKHSKRSTLFGEADTTQRIIVSIEYRVKDSSATYFKEKNYDVIISTSPVRMTITSVQEAVSGNEVELSVEIVSNSATVVSGMMLKVDYPFGFSYASASPAPTFSNNLFLLGDLSPADRRIIRIRGTVSGQEGEDRLFRVTLGLPNKQDGRQIGTIFLSSTKSIAIKKPFVSAVVTFEGSTNDTYNVEAGQAVRGEIAWANNLPSRIVDFEIQIKLAGESLNRLSVGAGGGFYRSIDNVILWDKTTSSSLGVVEPGENGILSFSFASLPVSSLLYSGTRGNEIALEITVRARRLTDANTSEQITSGSSKKVRISSNIALSGKSSYFTGPFANQGPIPPVAERNTTYTIVWSMTNTLNSASSVQVEAVLPGYVTWLGNKNPSNESIVFDATTRRVVWDVGDVPASTGFSGPIREAAFQVSLVPSLSQLGESPVLVGESVATGVDRFNNASLRARAGAITTVISDGTDSRKDGTILQE